MSSSKEAHAPHLAAVLCKIPRETLARVKVISERKIFWGMIVTVLVVIAGMTRDIFG